MYACKDVCASGSESRARVRSVSCPLRGKSFHDTGPLFDGETSGGMPSSVMNESLRPILDARGKRPGRAGCGCTALIGSSCQVMDSEYCS